MVEQRPITMISCGYAKRYRRQDLIDGKIKKLMIYENTDHDQDMRT